MTRGPPKSSHSFHQNSRFLKGCRLQGMGGYQDGKNGRGGYTITWEFHGDRSFLWHHVPFRKPELRCLLPATYQLASEQPHLRGPSINAIPIFTLVRAGPEVSKALSFICHYYLPLDVLALHYFGFPISVSNPIYSIVKTQMPFCPIKCILFHDTPTSVLLLCLGILSIAAFLFTSVISSEVYPGTAVLIQRSLPPCVSLAPTRGAVTYWPLRWGRGSDTPPPINLNTSVWSLELCLGAAHAHASFLDPLPGKQVSYPILGGREEYCTGADTCTGTLRVTRLHGCPRSGVCGALSPLGVCEPLPPLAPGTPASIIRDAQLLGPDELLMVLEGGELLTPHGVHLGNCSYVFPFSVTIPGAYRVGVFGVHADWDALDETTFDFPPLTLDNIAGDDLYITLGSVSAGPAVREAVLQQHSLAPGAATYTVPLPLCSNPMASQGRWVTNGSSAGLDTLPPPRVQVRPPWGPGVPYQHSIAPGRPLDVAFLPYTCRWPLPGSQPQGCFENRTVHFRGDSQIRTVFNHFMVSVIGMSLKPALKGVEGATCVDSIRFKDEVDMENNFLSCCSVDAMGSEPLSLWSGNALEPHPYAVVLNFGQHWAAEYRVSAAAYEGFLGGYFSHPALLEEVRARGESFMGFVWVETPPLNILNHEHVHSHRDGRTMHRIRLYNAAARRALRVGEESSRPSANSSSRVMGEWGGKGGAPVHFIPTFDIIFPVLDASEDHAHQDGVAASLNPITQAMRAVLCADS